MICSFSVFALNPNLKLKTTAIKFSQRAPANDEIEHINYNIFNFNIPVNVYSGRVDTAFSSRDTIILAYNVSNSGIGISNARVKLQIVSLNGRLEFPISNSVIISHSEPGFLGHRGPLGRHTLNEYEPNGEYEFITTIETQSGEVLARNGVTIRKQSTTVSGRGKIHLEVSTSRMDLPNLDTSVRVTIFDLDGIIVFSEDAEKPGPQRYEFTQEIELPAGNYIIYVSAPGFVGKSNFLEVKSNEIRRYVIRINREELNPRQPFGTGRVKVRVFDTSTGQELRNGKVIGYDDNGHVASKDISSGPIEVELPAGIRYHFIAIVPRYGYVVAIVPGYGYKVTEYRYKEIDIENGKTDYITFNMYNRQLQTNTPASGQGSVVFSVYDGATNNVITNAVATIYGESLTTSRATTSGSIEADLPVGRYNFDVAAPGYENTPTDVSVIAGTTSHIKVFLGRASPLITRQAGTSSTSHQSLNGFQSRIYQPQEFANIVNGGR